MNRTDPAYLMAEARHGLRLLILLDRHHGEAICRALGRTGRYRKAIREVKRALRHDTAELWAMDMAVIEHVEGCAAAMANQVWGWTPEAMWDHFANYWSADSGAVEKVVHCILGEERRQTIH